MVGFHVELAPPSATAVMAALRMATVRKDHLLDRHDTGLPCWECHGIPARLAVGRTHEFETERLMAAGAALGFELIFHRPRKPWFEDLLDDWFGRLSVDHRDPSSGLVSYEWLDRRRETSETLPVLGLKELEWLITGWVIDDYHQEPQRGLGCTPAEKWALGLQGIPFRRTPPDDLLDRVLVRSEDGAARYG